LDAAVVSPGSAARERWEWRETAVGAGGKRFGFGIPPEEERKAPEKSSASLIG
jgi:hypothetical protein